MDLVDWHSLVSAFDDAYLDAAGEPELKPRRSGPAQYLAKIEFRPGSPVGFVHFRHSPADLERTDETMDFLRKRLPGVSVEFNPVVDRLMFMVTPRLLGQIDEYRRDYCAPSASRHDAVLQLMRYGLAAAVCPRCAHATQSQR